MNLTPNTQLKLYGLDNYLLELIKLFEKNNLPNKIILSGDKGSGKATMAYHLINHVLSYGEEFSYDKKKFTINDKNKSFKLILNKSSPNFTLIDISENKRNIDINQIRTLITNLNKSSFNDKPRFVLIDNIEYLNVSAINALLKIIEEPNPNIYFILIHNNKKILSTLLSRCLNFKISLSHEDSINISNFITNKNIINEINYELINYYFTPGNFYDLIKISNDFEINLKSNNLKDFLKLLIDKNSYKKTIFVNNLLYSYIELYLTVNKLYNLYSYFVRKINECKKYNLDDESIYLEFKTKVLNG
tara:strand:+ start:221 stop:1132 length:912 start_codon:yes stop_codon:yes gene_type:complete